MTRKHLSSVTIFLLLVAVVGWLYWLLAIPRYPSQPPLKKLCFSKEENYYVTAGETSYKIPNSAGLWVNGYSGNTGVCDKPAPVFFSTDAFSFFIRGTFPMDLNPMGIKSIGMTLQVNIRPSPVDGRRYSYAVVREKLSENGIDLKDLPKIGDFYRWEGPEVWSFFHCARILIQDKSATFDQEPAIFNCTRDDCELSIWKNGQFINVRRLNPNILPVERFSDFYQKFQIYIDGLMCRNPDCI